MPKVSLIIPVYNTEKYLERCLDSVCKQSYTDIEIILIDDGSKDRSLDICDSYAKRDKRFRVIHKQNEGVSAARNDGIQAASGEYVMFCDSDDELGEGYVSAMMKERYSECDLVISGVKKINDNGTESRGLGFKDLYVDKIDKAAVEQMTDTKALDYIYAKRYKKSILDRYGIRFNQAVNLGEDTLFVAEYLVKCENIAYCSKQEYLYYTYAGSNNLSGFNATYVERLEIANGLIVKCLEKKYPDIERSEAWERRIWSVYKYSIFYILREWQADKRDRKRALRYIMKADKFRELCGNIDTLMPYDSRHIRWMLKTCNTNLVWYMQRLLENKLK